MAAKTKTTRTRTRTRTPGKRAATPAKRRTAAKKSSRAGARAMWKGTVTFGSLTVPVKLYSAVQDKSIHFRLLDAKSKEPVTQHMVDADSGDVVESASVRKALQVSQKRMVVLDDTELDRSEPKDSREIDVSRFV